MKLKSILAFCFGCALAMAVSVAAYAATEVKVEGAYIDEEGYVNLPVVVNSTDATYQITSYEITVNYDATKYTYDTVVDKATYTSHGTTSTMGTLVPNENTAGVIEIAYACGGGNGFPTVTDGTVTLLCLTYLAPVDNTQTEVSDSEFSVTVNFIEDFSTSTAVKIYGTSMKSYFTFDVTGDLGGNKVVALYASTDDGVTKQQLKYYTTTDYDSTTMEYADATTTFLVAVENDQRATAAVDITIYGQLEDGTYVLLGDYTQSDFLVQTFA
ncbi:MAG: hypothetical protein LUD77_11980 [Clostridiales bacterium]|nr:hypothetical protein [Clostridiales bacterium]